MLILIPRSDSKPLLVSSRGEAKRLAGSEKADLFRLEKVEALNVNKAKADTPPEEKQPEAPKRRGRPPKTK